MRLRDKSALITGAARGIGAAFARAYVAEGATVWATDKDVALLDGIPKAKKRKLDVLSTKAVEAYAAFDRREVGWSKVVFRMG